MARARRGVLANTGAVKRAVDGTCIWWYELNVRGRHRPRLHWVLVALVVGALLVVGLGMSMLAAHETETRAARILQPEATILAAKARTRPPLSCVKTRGSSLPSAEFIASAKDEEHEAACLHRRRALTGGQLATLRRELQIPTTSPVASWFPADAQFVASRTLLGLWASLIAVEVFGAIWLSRVFGGGGRTREA